MNRRGFFARALGAVAAVVVYPLDKAFEAALKPSEEFKASIGSWNNYYSEGDPELMDAIENWKSHSVHHTASLYYDKGLVSTLKAENNYLFEQIASRKNIPVNTGVKREFFRYES